MKKRIFLSLWGIFLLFQSVSLTAQTQISENYLISGPFTDYVAPMKYSYTVSDEGERVMNGPISISGRQNETYGNVTITGNYVLNAAAKNGNLNGSMSVKANYHGVKQLFRGQEVEDYAYSFSGSFINGVPNGTFTVKATNFGSSTVTYKQGVLVGSYYVDEIIDDRILTIKGSFNDSGKMVGVWDIKKFGDTEVWEFVNGVRVRMSSKHSESTPKQIEMAKKYASGTITKEALEEEGYFPVQDSIALGDYSSDLYFLKFIADWDKLPGRNFKKGFWVKYSYLYNLLPLPAREFEKVLSNYKNNGEAPLPVKYDELAKCYVTNYYENYGTPQVKLVYDRRFTESQLKAIDEAIDNYCRQNPISLSQLFYVTYAGYDVRQKAAHIQSGYGEVNDFKIVSEAIKKVLDGKEKTADGLYYIIPGEKPLTSKYFSVSNLDDYYALEQKVTREAEEKRLAREKAIEEKRNVAIQGLREGLSGIENQSANKANKQIDRMIVQMNNNYYYRVPQNPLNINTIELAYAIAPVTEYRVVDIKEEPEGYDTYRVKIEFKNQQGTVPVLISITKEGKIIDGSFDLPKDILNTAREKTKNKQAVSKAFSDILKR